MGFNDICLEKYVFKFFAKIIWKIQSKIYYDKFWLSEPFAKSNKDLAQSACLG